MWSLRSSENFLLQQSWWSRSPWSKGEPNDPSQNNEHLTRSSLGGERLAGKGLGWLGAPGTRGQCYHEVSFSPLLYLEQSLIRLSAHTLLPDSLVDKIDL